MGAIKKFSFNLHLIIKAFMNKFINSYTLINIKNFFFLIIKFNSLRSVFLTDCKSVIGLNVACQTLIFIHIYFNVIQILSIKSAMNRTSDFA